MEEEEVEEEQEEGGALTSPIMEVSGKRLGAGAQVKADPASGS